jgi:uncharacterized protein (DUF1697 family)
MAEFKLLLEGLGHTQVKTLLNSGNAVFTSPGRSAAKHAGAIGASVQSKFGLSTPVIVKAAAELTAIVQGNPMVPPEPEHSRFLVVVGPDRNALATLRPLLALVQGSERLIITKDAAYLHCPDGLLVSKVAAVLLGKAGRALTSRNWATMLKLATLVNAA